MFPITEDKFLLKFLGKTLLEHQIELAMKAGLKDFIIVGNQFNIEKIRKVCAKLEAKIELVVQKGQRGMASAILSVGDLARDHEVILVNPNDIFEQALYEKILEEGRECNYDSLIAAKKVSSYFPGGYLVVDEKLRIHEIHEKPGEGREPSDLVNVVVHFHRDFGELLRYLEGTLGEKDDVYERALLAMAKNLRKLKAVIYDGEWIAIKYPWHVLDAMEYFFRKLPSSQIPPSAEVSDKAVLMGKLMIEDNVKIMEGAILKGPCYIGKGTVVGNNALIRDFSCIGEDSVIGYSTEIKHSYIGNKCYFHSNYIGDSVIADECLFGYGTITANFRFDKKPIKMLIEGAETNTKRTKLGAIVGENSCIGVNSVLMPGVKVGPNSIVGPNMIVYQDVEPDTAIFLKQEYTVKKSSQFL